MVHGLTDRPSGRAYPPSVHERATTFIRNYAETHGLQMPAAPRGRAQNPPIYLPASSSFKAVHDLYTAAQPEEDDLPMLSYEAFLRTWHVQCSDIQFMTPRSDVCASCESYRNHCRVAATEADKILLTNNWTEHLREAQAERDHYSSCVKRAREAAAQQAEANDGLPAYSHLTFDFAENFLLPYHARQPGPVYFKSLYRVNDFGIINEGEQYQEHYLFGESQCIKPDNGKSHGPNNVVSMLHHFLDGNPHSCNLSLHCDNCAGQNKNKTLMGYMAWRILCKLEDTIDVSFMTVGHTRCAVDGGFGLAKKKYRASDVDTLDQLQTVVFMSSAMNMVTRFPDWEWCDWDAFISARFKKVAGITRYQHFTFKKELPGHVEMRQTPSSEEVPTTLNLLKPSAPALAANVLPEPLGVGGLSHSRKDYLLKNLLEFCHPEERQDFQKMLD